MKTKIVDDTIDAYTELLSIDRDDLASALIGQVEAYYNVASNHVRAQAKRDALKLDIDELHAALDQKFRREAEQNEEKITEGGIQQRIKDDVDMRALRQDHLKAGQLADEWGALKDAFSQRSYMLRELVALTLRQLSLESESLGTQRDHNALRAESGKLAVQKVGHSRVNLDPPSKRLRRST